MTTRRGLLIALSGVALATWPLASGAQQPRVRIAWLNGGSAAPFAIYVDAFKDGLRENGLIEGEHYILDVRWAEGRYERLPELVNQLLQRKPDVIVANTIAAVRAAQQATTTIPIVMTGTNDPVGARLVASLARPGGNTTGLSTMVEDVTGKLIDFIREVAPRTKQLSFVLNPGNPTNLPLFNNARGFAGSSGITVSDVELKSPDDLDSVFAGMIRRRPDALLVAGDAMLNAMRDRVTALALTHRLPVFTYQPDYTDAGALLSYGPSQRAYYRRAAGYVKKTLDGAKPADLPVEQPTRIELSINVRTAEVLELRFHDRCFCARTG